jgi:TetR/AcrR family transcriptional repressor of nem operon
MTKQLLINEAMNIVQNESFEKLSFQMLADRVGIKKGSVYYHFPSKEKLAIAVIEDANRQLTSYFLLIEHQTLPKWLNSYIQLFSVHIAPLDKLCPAASFVTTWPTQTEAVKAAVKKLYQTHIKYISNFLHKERKTGSIIFTAISEMALAEAVFAMLQGALLTARVSADISIFTTCETALLNLLKPGITK